MKCHLLDGAILLLPAEATAATRSHEQSFPIFTR